MNMDPLLRQLCIRHPEQMPPELLERLIDGRPFNDGPPVKVYVELIDRPVTEVEPGQITLDQIVKAVCVEFNARKIDILSQRRTSALVTPRQVFCYLAKHLTTQSLPRIGCYLGGRDHTTIIHAIRKVAVRLSFDEELAARVTNIKTRLGLTA